MDEDTTFELLYKPPHEEQHQNLSKVLDEIIKRIEKIENQLKNLN